MQRSSWVVILVVGAVALAAVLVGVGMLLALAAFWRLTVHGGMMGGSCPWCGGAGMPGGANIATILVLLFIGLAGLAILGLLIVGALWWVRSSKQPKRL